MKCITAGDSLVQSPGIAGDVTKLHKSGGFIRAMDARNATEKLGAGDVMDASINKQPISSAQTFFDALALPPAACPGARRIPKKLLLEHAKTRPGDKTAVTSEIEELLWLAALKPGNCGVPAAGASFAEIQILRLALRAGAKHRDALASLIHRAIPYPVVLIGGTDGAFPFLSLARIHPSLAPGGGIVADAPVSVTLAAAAATAAAERAFLGSLAFDKQPRENLAALYEGWIGCALRHLWNAGFPSAKNNDAGGMPALHALRKANDNLSAALASAAALKREIAALRARAKATRAIDRRVEINLQIRAAQARLDELCAKP
jgi:hypothetical protein